MCLLSLLLLLGELLEFRLALVGLLLEFGRVDIELHEGFESHLGKPVGGPGNRTERVSTDDGYDRRDVGVIALSRTIAPVIPRRCRSPSLVRCRAGRA